MSTITKKQRVAVAAIVIVGALITGGVLMTERHKTAEDAEHADEHAHGKDEHKEGEKENAHEEHGHGKEEHAEEGKDKHAEGQIKLDEKQLKAAGIELRQAGPAKLQAATEFPGEIRFNEDRTARVVPRVAGVAEAVMVNLGQQVTQGQVLALIASTSIAEQRSELLTAQSRREAAKVAFEREKKLWVDRISAEQDYLQAKAAWNEAEIAVHNAAQKLSAIGAGSASAGLNVFEVRAPFSGTIIEKHLAMGEAVKDDANIFMVSDMGTVWAEFAIAPKDLAAVRMGQKVLVSSTAFEERVQGSISYVGALLGEQTRTARARVTITNPKGAWRPGLFVTVSVLGEEQEVPLAVSADAVQTIENQTSVFIAVPGGLERRAVRIGRNDGTTAEVLSGVKASEGYAATNTYILKSELGKDGADHGH